MATNYSAADKQAIKDAAKQRAAAAAAPNDATLRAKATASVAAQANDPSFIRSQGVLEGLQMGAQQASKAAATPAASANPLGVNELRGVYQELLGQQKRQTAATNTFNQAQAVRQAQTQAAIAGYTPEMAARAVTEANAAARSNAQAANASLRDYETGLYQQQDANTQQAVMALAESNPEFYQSVLRNLAGAGSWDAAFAQTMNENGWEIPDTMNDYQRAAQSRLDTENAIQSLRDSGQTLLADYMQRQLNLDLQTQETEMNNASQALTQQNIINDLSSGNIVASDGKTKYSDSEITRAVQADPAIVQGAVANGNISALHSGLDTGDYYTASKLQPGQLIVVDGDLVKVQSVGADKSYSAGGLFGNSHYGVNRIIRVYDYTTGTTKDVRFAHTTRS
jgi:hypothetical protein